MDLSLKARHLGRWGELARLLLKHGRGDLVRSLGPGLELPSSGDEGDGAGDPEELARDLERMGPTFVKLGQLLSTRPDLLPPPYIEALERLQNRVEPFPYRDVEEIVEEELGSRVARAFTELHPTPLAAASLAQVHRARLRDGREVAVKVQRPGIRERVAEDLEVLERLAGVLDRHTEVGRRYAFGELLAEFRRTLLRELDFRREARNLVILRENLSGYETIRIPAPVDDYTTSRLLTMEYVHGTRVSELNPVVMVEVDGAELAGDLLRAYLDQVLIHGFFHADPHPGNVLLTEDRRLVLLDLGMVKRVGEETRRRLLQLLLAVSEGRGRAAAEVGRSLSQPMGEVRMEAYARRVSRQVQEFRHASLGEMQVGQVLLALVRASAEEGLRPPPELSVLGRTLLQLDHVARTLDPEFRPNRVVHGHVTALIRGQALGALSPGNLFSAALETGDLLDRLPARLNRLLDTLSENRLRVRVDALDEEWFIASIQKVANRIALGLVLAALIVGAAMLMRTESAFTILGYPGLAMVLFLVAAGLGLGLVAVILWRDRTPRRGPEEAERR